MNDDSLLVLVCDLHTNEPLHGDTWLTCTDEVVARWLPRRSFGTTRVVGHELRSVAGNETTLSDSVQQVEGEKAVPPVQQPEPQAAAGLLHVDWDALSVGNKCAWVARAVADGVVVGTRVWEGDAVSIDGQDDETRDERARIDACVWALGLVTVDESTALRTQRDPRLCRLAYDVLRCSA